MKKNHKKDIGIDVERNARFFNLNDYFVQRILTINELNEFNKIKNLKKKAEYLASRWTCKEAIFKIKNDIIMTNIEILNDKNNRLFCTTYNNIKLSVSHTNEITVAIALLVD